MHKLKRAIGLPAATALVVGTIIGSSIFVQASEITLLVPDPIAVVLAWAVAGALTLVGALVCAELASAYPRTGGVYVYLKEVYSPLLGFVWGWATFWSMHTGILAAVATVFARYAGFFVPLDDTGLRAVAIGAIMVLSAVNYVGVRFGGGVQTAFTVVKVLAVLAIIILGWALSGDVQPSALDNVPPVTITLTNFSLAVAAGLFAFGGWHMVTYTAEETIDPTRTIPRSLMIGIAVVTVCYIGLNAVYLRVLPIEKVMTSARVAADTFEVLVGAGGAGLIAALVMFSAFGALNGIILAKARVAARGGAERASSGPVLETDYGASAFASATVPASCINAGCMALTQFHASRAIGMGMTRRPRLPFAAHDATEIDGERGHVDTERAFSRIAHEPATAEPSQRDRDV
jgi:APA family basic amino acid/polyamine antiporter